LAKNLAQNTLAAAFYPAYSTMKNGCIYIDFSLNSGQKPPNKLVDKGMA